MPKHSIAPYRWAIHPRASREERQAADFDGNGSDLLNLFNEWAESLGLTALNEDRRERYSRVQSLQLCGRACRVKMQSGRYGSPGRLVHVESGSTTYEHSDREAPMLDLRHALVVPPVGPVAMFFAERVGNVGATRVIFRNFRDYFRQRHEGLILTEVALVDAEAFRRYLADAALTQITLVRYGLSADIADDPTAEPYGRYEHRLVSTRHRHLPHRLLDRLMSRDLKPGVLLGLADDIEIDETNLTLERDGTQRTFTIERLEASVPSLTYTVSAAGDPAPDDDTFYAEVRKIAEEHLPALGPDVRLDWQDGGTT